MSDRKGGASRVLSKKILRFCTASFFAHAFRTLAWPLGIYLLALVFFVFLGFHGAEIPWDYYQILDRDALARAPLRSLLLLHSQPPVLNALLAALLQWASWFGGDVLTWATGLFFLLGAVCAVLFYRLLLDISASRTVASIGLLLALSDPGYHFYQHLIFYEFLVYCLVVCVLFLVHRLFQTFRASNFYAILLLLVTVTNTRTLFPSVWAVTSAFLLLALLCLIHGRERVLKSRHTATALSLFAIALLLWPTKNLLVFNSFTYSSQAGYNLGRGTPYVSDSLARYLREGTVPEPTLEAIAAFREDFGPAEIHLIAGPTKFDGSRNWNHFLFLQVDESLAKQGVRWRLAHGSEWMQNAWQNYLLWARPTYIHPYTNRVWEPRSARHLAYADLHRQILFAPFSQSPDQSGAVLTVFSGIVLPCLLAFSLFMTIRVLWCRPLRLTPATAMAVFAGFLLAWTLLVPCLTDGAEGNRMRFAVTPCILVLLILLAQSLRRIWSARGANLA